MIVPGRCTADGGGQPLIPYGIDRGKDMRIDVVGLNIEVTDAIREHAEAKAGKLIKFFDGVQQIVFRLSREDHQHHGTYGVEVVVDAVKNKDFVSRAQGEDLYAAIDLAVQRASRQVADFKERLRDVKRGPVE